MAPYHNTLGKRAPIKVAAVPRMDTAMSTNDARHASPIPLNILLFALAALCFLGVGATIAHLLS